MGDHLRVGRGCCSYKYCNIPEAEKRGLPFFYLTPACFLLNPYLFSAWPLPVFCLTPACFLPDPCLSSALFLSVFYLYCCLSSAWLKRFACEKKRIAPITLLSWAMGANHSRSLFCKERQEWFTLGHKKGKNCSKTVKNCQNLWQMWIFSRELLVFESQSLKSRANHSCRSFLQRDSLTIDLL